MEDKSYHKALETGVSDGTHSGNRGVQENYRRKADVQHEANKLGEALSTGVAALFLHPYFCFVGFWMIGFGSLLALAPSIGASGANLNGLQTWYAWTAAIIPLPFAWWLRRIIPKLMAAALVTVVVSLAILMYVQVRDLREARATKAAAMPPAAAPAALRAAPRTPTPEGIRQALLEAARPETTAIAPQEGPANEFQTAYCTSVAAAERPEWCP